MGWTSFSRAWAVVLVVLASLTLTGCHAIAEIFKAGVWVGAILVIIVVLIVSFIVYKIRG